MTLQAKHKKTLIMAGLALAAAAAAYYLWHSSQPQGPGDGFVSGNGHIEATELNATSKLPKSALQALYLDAQPINRIDVTGVESFLRLRQSLQKRGIDLHIGGLKLPVQAILDKAGCLSPGPGLHLHRTNTQALAFLRNAY